MTPGQEVVSSAPGAAESVPLSSAPGAAESVPLSSEEAGQHTALGELPPPRRALLAELKACGEATAELLSEGLDVTVGAVRQQLGRLEQSGLVAHRDERHGPGRPRRWYCLTAAAETLWPKRYGQLTNQLLGVIEETDPEIVQGAFARRGEQRRVRALGRLAGRPFEERIAELTRILDEDGYLADCEEVEPGVWRISERNCAILDVASRYGAACQSELGFLRGALPDASVERVAHIVAGAHRCAYEVRRLSPPALGK